MKPALILIISLSYFFVPTPNNIWQILSELKFNIYFDEKLDDIVFEPKPTPSILDMEDEIITIQGFKSIHRFEGDIKSNQNSIALCRFKTENEGCTSSFGDESYIEIIPNKALKLVEGKLYSFRGIFKMNTKDLDKLPFTLKEATCLDCNS